MKMSFYILVIFVSILANYSAYAEPNTTDLSEDFKSGNFRLKDTFCGFSFGYNEKKMKDLYEMQEWTSLVKKVMDVNCSSNLMYFYLGRSAEGMGLDSAANIYFKLGKSSRECISDHCGGLNFPTAIDRELQHAERKKLDEQERQKAQLASEADNKAESGDANAKFERGQAYQNGIEVHVNLDAAKKWYKKASDAGSSIAAYSLGNILMEQGAESEAIQQWKVAAKAGNADANLAINKYEEEQKQAKQNAFAQEATKAAQAKVEAARLAKERQQAAAFRKSFKQGDETSCGLVIEKKGNLAKLQLTSSNTEKWVKLEDIYPVSQVCPLNTNISNTGNSKNDAIVGQKVCRQIGIKQIVNYTIVGQKPIYNTDQRYANITGFVENKAGSKLQIRISGMQVNGSNVSHIDGDVVYENGSIIWDEAASWNSCI